MQKLTFFLLFLFSFISPQNLSCFACKLDRSPEYACIEIQLFDYLNRHVETDYTVSKTSRSVPSSLQVDMDKNSDVKDLRFESALNRESESVSGFNVPLILVVVVFLLAFLFNRAYSTPNNNESKYFFKFLFPQRLSAWQEKTLLNEVKFYKVLSPGKRKKFGNRILRFLLDKKFEGQHELEVTETMKLLIASTAVRITFGLKTYTFPSFHTFLIFPEVFYSRISGMKVKGETHGIGIIAFSWKDFMFGLKDGTDNLNLGYHEFAHALFIEHFKNNIDIRFMDNYDAWRKLVLQENKLKEAAQKQTFRKYANHNEHEFFSVSVENFFERPEKFKQDLPELYQIMINMMNQDPLEPF